MGNELFFAMRRAANQYKEETGDTKVESMLFTTQTASDGYAADWHPTEKTHTKAATRLTTFIEELLAQ